MKPLESPKLHLIFRLLIVGAISISVIYTVKTYLSKKTSKQSVLSGQSSISAELEDLKKQTGDIIGQAIDAAQKNTSNVLGEVAKTFSTTASKTVDTAKDAVIDSAIQSVMKEIDKLPEKQKEEIRKEVCK